MRIQRPRPESVLALAAVAVGVLGIASALAPWLPGRAELVASVLPAGFPAAARTLTIAFGLALIWLAGPLARRRRRAWGVAAALVAGISVTHLASDLDAEQAAVSLLLLAALLRARPRFDVQGDPTVGGPLARLALLLAAPAAFLGLYALHRLHAPEDAVDVTGAAAVLLSFRALQVWLRPWAHRVTQSDAERRLARSILLRHGRDSLSYFTLRRDKSYFFSPCGGAFLAYRVVGGTALVSGDPVGGEAELRPLLESFLRAARAHGWRVAVLGAGESHLPLYESLGLRGLRLGDEAVVRPESFSLDGRPIRKVRQSVHRLRRAGYSVAFVPAGGVPPALRAELDAVSRAWRGRWPERGFTMAMDDFYSDPAAQLAIARDADGCAQGFLHLVPAPAGGGWSLSAMRRSPETPNGLMEYLVVETVEWAAARRAPELSLNFCAFADLIRERPERALAGRLARVGLLRADHAFQLARLLRFNAKFFPEWRPRYLCLERLSDFPAVGLAWLHAESLLAPPSLLPVRTTAA